jgi:hypothetical protein
MPFPNFHSCRIKEPNLFEEDSIRTLHTKQKGLTLLVGKLKSNGKSETQAFRYDKKDWSSDRAKTHCDSHDGNFEPAKKTEKSNHLYEIHRKVHQMWNEDEIDKGLLTKMHSSIIQEYSKEEMIHFKIDDLDKSINERWNKTLSKCFDVSTVESKPATFEYSLFSKFLSCPVKDLFLNSFLIPSPLLGTYLAGFKKVLSEYDLKDTRSFNYGGSEQPPVYEVIKLNSKESDDFLIDGVNFYTSIIVKYAPCFMGLTVSLTTSIKNREWNKEIMKRVHDWVMKNNYMKNEKFELNGEFLTKTEDSWDSLFLEDDVKNSLINITKILKNNTKETKSRGLLFIGNPGTGKTKSGRVLMNKIDSTFIWVSSKDFINRYGEENPIGSLSLAFKLARDLAPTILFIEDIDMWLGGNMIDLLKTELDGLKENKNIVTILTSNEPEKLPNTLLDRPGRFHDILDFALPSEEKRKEMVSKWVGDIKEKTIEEIVKGTENFSGAHMKELIDFAKILKEENEEFDINDALLRSLEKMQRQRHLVEDIRSR